MRFSGWDRVATFTCGSQLAFLPWIYEQPVPGMYTTLCNYEPATGAWATCVDEVIRRHADPKSYEKTLIGSVSWVKVVCRKAGGHLSHFDFDRWNMSIHNASDYLMDLRLAPTPLNYPVELEYKSIEKVVDAVHAEFANLDNSNDSVAWIYYYFITVIATLMLLQIPRIREMCLKNRFLNKLRSKISLPTMWNTKKHSQHASMVALGGLMPSSLEALLLVGFFTVHTISLYANYSVDPREVMESTNLQRLQALGNRSGIVSFGLLPLIVVFSSRSNLFPKLTGMRYTTFLVLHRWLGRISVIDAIIHSWAFYYHEYLTGELDNVGAQIWWKMGIVATFISLMIVILATGFLRSRWYEFFLYTHIALALAFFYFCWDHVKKFGWTYWIYYSCIIWALERTYRLYSITRNGICQAEVTEVNPNLIILEIPKPQKWRTHPTQFAFVHFLLPSIFWQSHPFTITDTGDVLKIVVLVKSGATRVVQRAIRNRSQGDNAKKTTISILLEGPYGVTPTFTMFKKILLFSGGSGIPGPLALARALHQDNFWDGDAHLITVIREMDVMRAYAHEMEELLTSNCVSVDLYYTGNETVDPNRLQLQRSRPDVRQILETFVASTNSLAVVCCGPPGLNDRVRNVVSDFVSQNTEVVIEYFEEFQIW